MADDGVSSRPHPVVQLTLMRLRELRREPGTLFWVFGFPILISIALGLAFRRPGPSRSSVGALPGVSDEITGALVAGGVKVEPLDEAAARNELRSGRVALVLVPPAGRGAALGYRYDPMRPEARLARVVVDDILQRADGRRDPRPVRDETVREHGARYIDFLIPGLIGHEPDVGIDVGHRLRAGEHAHAQAAQAAAGHADAAAASVLRAGDRAPGDDSDRAGRDPDLRAPGVRRAA